jgi:hypothetical protein
MKLETHKRESSYFQTYIGRNICCDRRCFLGGIPARGDIDLCQSESGQCQESKSSLHDGVRDSRTRVIRRVIRRSNEGIK